MFLIRASIIALLFRGLISGLYLYDEWGKSKPDISKLRISKRPLGASACCPNSGLGVPVAPAASPSSLQLTLENTRLRDSVDEYIRALAPIVEKSPGVVGFAFAVR